MILNPKKYTVEIPENTYLTFDQAQSSRFLAGLNLVAAGLRFNSAPN